MSAKDSQHDGSRRRFLGGLVASGAVVGVTSGGSALAMAQKPAPTTEEPTASSRGSGYQETAHVRRFYDLARG